MTWQGENAGNTGKGFPQKYIKKMRGNLVPKDTRETPHLSWEYFWPPEPD